MRRVLTSAVAIVSAVVVGMLAGPMLHAQDGAAAVPPPLTGDDADVGAVRLQGDAQALRVEVRDGTIADVLTAMSGTFDMRYRSSIALDGEISGTYAGPLTRVIARVLDGYNYAIVHERSALQVTIFGKSGEQATSGALTPATAGPARRGRSAGRTP